MALEKLISVGKSGIHLLDSNGRIEQAVSTESFLSHPNGCILSKNQLCISLLEKAKLVFVSSNQTFRASVPETMTSLEFSLEGELLYCGSKSGRLYIWQIRSGDLLYCEQIFYNEITDIKTDDKNSTLLLSSSNGDISLLNLVDVFTNKKSHINYMGHTSNILSVSNLLFGIYSKELSFLSISRDRNLRFWHQNNVNSTKSVYLNSNPIKLYKDKLGIKGYITCEDGNIVVVNLKTYELKYIKLHQGPIYTCIELDNLVTYGLDGIKIWDINHNTLIQQYQININISHLFNSIEFPKCNFKFKLLKFNKQEDLENYSIPVSL